MEEKIVLDKHSFKALAADSRVRILKILGKRRHTQSELAHDLKLSIPTVKEHLQALVKAGLVEKIDEGRKWKYYKLTSKGRGILDPEMKKIWILLSVIGLMVFAGLSGVLKQGFAPMYGFGEAVSYDTIESQKMVDSYREIPEAASAPTAAESGGRADGVSSEIAVEELDSDNSVVEEAREAPNPVFEEDVQEEYKLPRPDFSGLRFNTGVKIYLGILGVLCALLAYYAIIRYRRINA